jgi:hypothetical protein
MQLEQASLRLWRWQGSCRPWRVVKCVCLADSASVSPPCRPVLSVRRCSARQSALARCPVPRGVSGCRVWGTLAPVLATSLQALDSASSPQCQSARECVRAPRESVCAPTRGWGWGVRCLGEGACYGGWRTHLGAAEGGHTFRRDRMGGHSATNLCS